MTTYILKHINKFTIDEITGCWIWHCKTRSYPTIVSEGKRSYMRGGRRQAARTFYEEVNHVIVDKKFDMDHLCRTHSCVNPYHVEPTTRKVNARRGTSTTLTQADVDFIREDREVNKTPYKILAKKFGVGETAIEKIVLNQRWT